MALLKSTPPGTATCCLASLGPDDNDDDDDDDDDDPELMNEEGELEKELVEPKDEPDDGKEFDDVNEGAGANT